MLGYVRAYKPEMKFKDYDIYKGVYCSLCKTIGKRYGLLARLTLSYDFTFLALLRMAVREQNVKMCPSRCTFNPLKKCYDCSRDNLDLNYTADAAMLTFYFKLKDNIADSGFFKKSLCKILMPYANSIYKKAKRNCPETEKKISELMAKQSEIERCDVGLDQAADASAKMLSVMLSDGINTSDNQALERLGYFIGRWVYTIDAVDDCEDDIKSGSFNPLKKRYGEKDFKDYCEQTLSLTVGEALNALDGIKLYRFTDIINNVLIYGTYASAKRVLNREDKKNEKSI